MGELRNAYKILASKSGWKRLLGLSGHMCEYNIKMNLKGMGSEGVKWICLVEDRDW
jgi:hypothetical protein